MANTKTKAGPRKMWSQRLPISTIDRIVRLRDRLQGERGSAVSQAEVVEQAVKEMDEKICDGELRSMLMKAQGGFVAIYASSEDAKSASFAKEYADACDVILKKNPPDFGA